MCHVGEGFCIWICIHGFILFLSIYLVVVLNVFMFSPVCLPPTGGSGAGSGWYRGPEDRWGVPSSLVQRHQQHRYAHLRLRTNLG